MAVFTKGYPRGVKLPLNYKVFPIKDETIDEDLSTKEFEMIERSFGFALKGIHEAFTRIAERASRIAKFGESTDADGLTEDIIGIKQDAQAVQANAKVIKVVDETEKSILDILA